MWVIYALKTSNKIYKDYLTEDKVKKWIAQIEKAISDLDYVDIVWPILSSDGLKNNLHQCLKIASLNDGYYISGFQSVFGDIDGSVNEFNRVAQI